MKGFRDFKFARDNGYKGSYINYKEQAWKSYKERMARLETKPMKKNDFMDKVDKEGI